MLQLFHLFHCQPHSHPNIHTYRSCM
jgi:hypothetical protein